MSNHDENPVVAPAELDELAERAQELARAIEAAGARLRAEVDTTSRAGWRLDEAAGAALGVARALAAAASDLSLGPGGSICPVTWGVCPDHGQTLTGTAGRSWCRQPGCGRSWHYDRASLPCTEPVAFELRNPRDGDGGGALMCKGHAIAALELQADAVLSPYEEGSDEDA
jgi:hypothetical protein